MLLVVVGSRSADGEWLSSEAIWRLSDSLLTVDADVKSLADGWGRSQETTDGGAGLTEVDGGTVAVAGVIGTARRR